MGFIESSNTLRFSSNKLLIELCGQLDINLSKIESWAGVQIVRRGNALSIYGAKQDCDITRKLISDLYSDLEHGKTLDVYNKHISDYEKLIAKEFKDTNLDTFMKMIVKEGKVLDLGCGTGSASLELLKKGFFTLSCRCFS